MKIWIIDHYAVPPKYYPLARQTVFAKKLIERGHDVTIFASSAVHNSSINLIEDDSLYKCETVDGVPYVYIKSRSYEGNGLSRILNMEEFARKLPKVLKRFEKPDAVLSCSMTLQACRQGIRCAKRLGAKAVAQVTDLWPETLVEYGRCKKTHPYVLYLRRIEKWIYVHCDKLIFSMEGGYDYIEEQKWDKLIPQDKIVYINNGVDLEAFNYNKEHYQIDDVDLQKSDIFKIVYTGSIRCVNNLGILLDVAKKVSDPQIKFLVWGAGDEVETLKKRILSEKIDNVVLKGSVEKKYIPYITSQADLNILHNTAAKIFRFGISLNKMFDYFAAGKPILVDFLCPYNPVEQENAGLVVEEASIEKIAEAVIKMRRMDEQDYSEYGNNALKAAEKYDFNNLTEKLLAILND